MYFAKCGVDLGSRGISKIILLEAGREAGTSRFWLSDESSIVLAGQWTIYYVGNGDNLNDRTLSRSAFIFFLFD